MKNNKQVAPRWVEYVFMFIASIVVMHGLWRGSQVTFSLAILIMTVARYLQKERIG